MNDINIPEHGHMQMAIWHGEFHLISDCGCDEEIDRDDALKMYHALGDWLMSTGGTPA